MALQQVPWQEYHIVGSATENSYEAVEREGRAFQALFSVKERTFLSGTC